ncbi:hypothetical protein HMY34_00635 [Thiothrix subterranea]|uniref:hypothetical protein n=1 Tax=Thiothrix subterranea TaxID=2735563 RepID=UPI00192BA4DA|nr:hypothetical protein [Thiothrix subterranea]QQZ27378.1 hypothetical protein HMY34_00635 [Thiothrix subterranea]
MVQQYQAIFDGTLGNQAVDGGTYRNAFATAVEIQFSRLLMAFSAILILPPGVTGSDAWSNIPAILILPLIQ